MVQRMHSWTVNPFNAAKAARTTRLRDRPENGAVEHSRSGAPLSDDPATPLEMDDGQVDAMQDNMDANEKIGNEEPGDPCPLPPAAKTAAAQLTFFLQEPGDNNDNSTLIEHAHGHRHLRLQTL